MSANPRGPRGRAQRAALIATLIAVAIESTSAFLPWVRTGHRNRTSFEVISAARELDVLRSPLERVVAAAWYAMPLAAALGARRAMAMAAVAAGVLGIAVGRGVFVGPFAHYAALVVSLAASGVAVTGGIWILASTRGEARR
jgi:hypothetical protein